MIKVQTTEILQVDISNYNLRSKEIRILLYILYVHSYHLFSIRLIGTRVFYLLLKFKMKKKKNSYLNRSKSANVTVYYLTFDNMNKVSNSYIKRF